MWDQRYSNETYAYGTEPNDFLVAMYNKLPTGKALCLAEGEGRNAVWLAQQGLEVTAVDSSGVGLQKAKKLAKNRGVKINTVHTDLADFEIKAKHWDIIVSIFCHIPSKLRHIVHSQCVRGLRTGGMILLEAYTPIQLSYNSGGPSSADLMMDVQSLSDEFADLKFIHLQEHVRKIHEGEFHKGTGAVVQVLAKKP